jgi:hypothetical protein
MKIKLKYVKAYNSKGRIYFYFRRRGTNIPLPGPFLSSAFQEAYAMALDAHGGPDRVGAGRNAHGSVAALIGLYGETAHFKSGLAPLTRQQHWRILQRFKNDYGTKPVHLIEKKHIIAVLAKLTPAVQVTWVKVLKPMFQYGTEIEWLKQNPLKDVRVKYKGGEYTAWTEAEIGMFRGRHPLGTMPRLALELLLGTCMRGSDVVALGPANIGTASSSAAPGRPA